MRRGNSANNTRLLIKPNAETLQLCPAFRQAKYEICSSVPRMSAHTFVCYNCKAPLACWQRCACAWSGYQARGQGLPYLPEHAGEVNDQASFLCTTSQLLFSDDFEPSLDRHLPPAGELCENRGPKVQRISHCPSLLTYFRRGLQISNGVPYPSGFGLNRTCRGLSLRNGHRYTLYGSLLGEQCSHLLGEKFILAQAESQIIAESTC